MGLVGFYGSERQRDTLEGKKVEITEPMRHGQNMEPIIRNNVLNFLMREKIQLGYESPKSFVITHKQVEIISTNDGALKVDGHFPISFIPPGTYYPLEIKAPTKGNFDFRPPYLTQLTLEAVALNVDRTLYVSGNDKCFRLSVIHIPNFVKQQVLDAAQHFNDLKTQKITLKTYKSECSKFRRFCYSVAPNLVIYSVFVMKE